MNTRRTHKSFKYSLLAGVIGQALMSSHVNAQQSQTDQQTETEEKIVVTGRRVSQTDIAIGTDEATNTLAVSREELLSAPSGISGLKMLESLPGFNVQTDGALGLYEFGNSVQVRAFQLSHPVIEATFGADHARTQKSRARMSVLQQARDQSP